MNTNFLMLLKHEHQLLAELVQLSEKQQKALVKMQARELEEIAIYQEEVSKSLKSAEDKRIKMLMTMYKLNRQQASSLNLSTIAQKFAREEMQELEIMRKEMKHLASRLKDSNMLNRILANKARHSVREMITIISNGSNQVCNVTV